MNCRRPVRVVNRRALPPDPHYVRDPFGAEEGGRVTRRPVYLPRPGRRRRLRGFWLFVFCFGLLLAAGAVW